MQILLRTVLLSLLLVPINTYAQKGKRQTHLNGNVTSSILRYGKKKANKHQIELKFQVKSKRQPIMHRGFKVARFEPERISFHLMDKRGRVRHSQSVKPPFNVRHTISDSLKFRQLGLRISNVDLRYKRVDIRSTRLIDDYYQTKSKFENIESEVESIVFEDPDEIDNQEVSLRDQDRKLSTILKQDFPSRLPLNTFDPANFFRNSAEAESSVEEAYKRMNQAYANWHILYFEKGQYAHFENEKRRCFDLAIEKANFNNVAFPEPYYEIALLDYNDGDIDNCIQLLDQAHSMQTSSGLLQKIRILYRRVFEDYIDKASDNEGEEAIHWYYKALSICDKRVLQVNCESVRYEIRKIRTSLFLEKVNVSLANNSFEELATAREYFNRHKKEINDAAALDRAFQTLFLRILNDAKKEINLKHFGFAYALLLEIETKEQSYNIKFRNPLLIEETYSRLYDSAKLQANDYIRNKAYARAIGTIELLKKISGHKALWSKEILESTDTMLRKAHEGYFLQRRENIKALISAKNFSLSKDSLTKADNYVQLQQHWLPSSADSTVKVLHALWYTENFDYQLFTMNQQMGSNKLIDAAKTQREVLSFFQQNRSWMKGDADSRLLSSTKKLIVKLNRTAKQHFKNKAYTDASHFYQLALNSLYYTEVAEEAKMRKGLASSLFAMGHQYHINLDYGNALAAYDKALERLKKMNADLETKISSARLKCLADIISKTIRETTAEYQQSKKENPTGKHSNALYDAIENIEAFAQKNNFQIESELKLQLEKLNETAFKQVCYEKQLEFKRLITSAQQAVDNKTYTLALEYYRKAHLLAKDNKECQLPEEDAKRKMDYYNAVASYQYTLWRRKKHVTNREYFEALALCDTLDYQAELVNFSDFGISHQSTYDYLDQLSHPFFMRDAVIYYGAKQPDIVDLLLPKLIAQDQKNDFYRNMGYALGERAGFIFQDKSYKNSFRRFKKLKGWDFRRFRIYYKRGYKKSWKLQKNNAS